MKTQAVILAAGESSRFWPLNNRHKSLFAIMGKPIIWYTIDSLKQAGIKDVIIIQNKEKQIEAELKNNPITGVKIKYLTQEQPKGTGDAVLLAKDLLVEKFLVLNAEHVDACLYIKKILALKKDAVLTCSKTKNPGIYGIIAIQGDKVVDIVEKPQPGKEPSDFKILGIHVLNKEFLSYLSQEPNHPYSLMLALAKYAKQKNVGFLDVKKEESFTLKYPWDVFAIRDFVFKKYLKKKIQPGAKVAKTAVLQGDVFVAKGAKIDEQTVIKGPCYIGPNSVIAARNVLRGPLNIENDVHTGALMELKDSIIQSGTHFHSGYLGNSVIGRDCRFGAGLLCANRRIDRKNILAVVKGEKVDTGSTYAGFYCGDNAKFGVGVKTMPGIIIGNNVIVGPGITVFKNVEDNQKILQNES